MQFGVESGFKIMVLLFPASMLLFRLKTILSCYMHLAANFISVVEDFKLGAWTLYVRLMILRVVHDP